jgi:hypothetical protein
LLISTPQTKTYQGGKYVVVNSSPILAQSLNDKDIFNTYKKNAIKR